MVGLKWRKIRNDSRGKVRRHARGRNRMPGVPIREKVSKEEKKNLCPEME